MRGERGTLPGGTGWASHKGTCGGGDSCGGGRLTSALRSSTSMEESSSGSEWICTEAWVDQKAAVHRRWIGGFGSSSLEHPRQWRPLPLGGGVEPPRAALRKHKSRPQAVPRNGGGGGVSVLRCPQPDVLDVQLLPSAGELDLDGISGDGEGEQGRLRPEARLRGVQMCSRGVDVLKGCRCAQGM